MRSPPAFLALGPVLVCLLLGSFASFSRADELSDQFKAPPDSARPHTWWHWMNGNVTRDGITKDLEAMKRVGLGGFEAFSVTDAIPPGPVKYMSDEWLDMMNHAASEAKRLGLEMCMHNCAGWSSSGGPWITPEMSMQAVTWSEASATGGKTIEIELKEPPTRKDFYRDIAVIAFPTLAGDANGKEGFRLSDWEWKADRNTRGRKPDSQIVRDTRTAPGGDVIQASQVMVLSDKMDAAGKLKWDAPPGEWTIVRLGHTCTGTTNKPAPKEGEGLECDKLSKTAAKFQWDHSVQRVIDRVGPELAGKVFRDVLIDSYEVGFQNWTEGLDKLFKEKYGYELTPYFPCLSGRVVESVDTTERFLWDFRRLIADLMAENYFGAFKQLCHDRGMILSIEPYGPGGFDDFQVAAIADIPMGEFWIDRADAWHFWSTKIAASAAHANGISIVGDESFTARPPGSSFTDHPAIIKTLGDHYFAQGLSRIIFHTNVHQPWGDDVLPGMTMGPHGMQMNRNNTWHSHARPWVDHLVRTQFMLQHGQFVADLCYLASEDAPQTPLNRADMKPVPPIGYDYDVLHADFIRQMKVKKGRLVLPSGMSYAVLVLPDSDRMRPELLEKIGELAQAGATIYAPRKVVASPSLQHKGDVADEGVKKLSDLLWSSGQFGGSETFEQFLKSHHAKPDVDSPPANINWLHRRIGKTDVYFVSNQDQDQDRGWVKVQLEFRATGEPEIWHTDTGRIERARDVAPQANGSTLVGVRLWSRDSVFVVFREHSAAPMEKDLKDDGESEITGPWTLRFPDGWGPPPSVPLPTLISWSKHENDEIKHFSGTATYTTKFALERGQLGKNIALDLGDVQVMAEVKLNGKDLGLLWKPPYRVDATDAIHPGENELEVRVTNLWVNRLIGDEAYPRLTKPPATTRFSGGIGEIPAWVTGGEPKPQTQRKTFATWRHYKASDPLVPSGLIGPVRLVFSAKQSAKTN